MRGWPYFFFLTAAQPLVVAMAASNSPVAVPSPSPRPPPPPPILDVVVVVVGNYKKHGKKHHRLNLEEDHYQPFTYCSTIATTGTTTGTTTNTTSTTTITSSTHAAGSFSLPAAAAAGSNRRRPRSSTTAANLPKFISSQANQVGGHVGALKLLKDGSLIKLCRDENDLREISFYETLYSTTNTSSSNSTFTTTTTTNSLIPFIPQFYGRKYLIKEKLQAGKGSNTRVTELLLDKPQLDEYYKSLLAEEHEIQLQHSTDNSGCCLPTFNSNQHTAKKRESPPSIQCIHFENIASSFKSPCIMDLKIGRRHYADWTPLVVKTFQKFLASVTTSAEYALRIVGFKTQHPATNTLKLRKKEWGVSLSNANFCQKGILSFFKNNDKLIVHPSILSQIHSQLVQLAEVLRNQPVRLYDSSILIAFDGHTAWQPFYLNQNSSSSPSSSLFSSNSSSSLQDHIPLLQSNVKLIDFTNGHFIISDQKQESGPDLDAIYGIETAAAMIETIRVQLVDCIRLAHQHAVALDVMKHQLRKCIKENVKC